LNQKGKLIKVFEDKFLNNFHTFEPHKKTNIMASIALGGNPTQTSGELPKVGSKIADFKLVKTDLSYSSLADYVGKKIVLNIFPSVDTGTCAASVRKFNERASTLENTTVLCISRDLPFAQKRFCGAEGLANVVNLSDFLYGSFGKTNGLEISDGPLSGLHSRVVIVVDENGTIIHTEQVAEIADEPNYEAALAVL
jgi:thiol peroxidase